MMSNLIKNLKRKSNFVGFKKSIKWKITIAFIAVVVFCIGSIYIFNTLFLEKLYINDKKNVIKKAYYALENGIIESYDLGYTLSDLFNRRFNNSGESDDSSLVKFLRELQEIYGVSTVLMDSDNKVYSLFQNNTRFDRRMKAYIYKAESDDSDLKILEKNELYTIAIKSPERPGVPVRPRPSNNGPSEYYESSGPSSDIRKESNNNKSSESDKNSSRYSDIECFGFLSDNQTAFFLTIPVGSIKEPIVLFNKVLVMTSIFITLIGSIVIYIVSNNLTKPLLELSKLSKKMSKLEFENKYEGKFEDEIGILGNAMNELSDKLEKNIRELKNANIQLKKDLEQKEQLDLMRQEFVANVSHELKTPIALIKGYTEGLETEGIAYSKENRDYYINVIKDETDRMNILVRQLLDLSALERGATDIDIERIDLYEVFNGIIENYNIKIKELGLKIDCDIQSNTFVWADGYKLEEVCRNYLTNAFNHVDENKYVRIYTEDLDADKIRLNIFNTGVQLSKDDMNKIWEKFYKVDKAHTRSYGGSGLGLSIVKAIATQHGTKCGCENDEYNGLKGMRFYFDFSKK